MNRTKKKNGARAGIARLVVLLALLAPTPALAALRFIAPLLDNGDGSVACTNCCTGSSLTTGALIIGGGTSAVSALANNGAATVMYATNASGLNGGLPHWRAPAILDYGTGLVSAADLSTVLAAASETGTAGKLVWDTAPTISAPVLTGAASFSGVTGSVSWAGTTAPMTFPTDTFADFTDFNGTIKTGGTNGTKLVTAGTFTPGANNCAKWNVNGTLEDHGSACGGGSSIKPYVDVSPMTQVTASTTPLFCGLDGSCSATADGADVQTPLLGTGSYTSLECRATAATGQAITVVLGRAATCGSTLDVTTKAQSAMVTTAWAAATPTGTTSWTGGDCVALKITTASGTSNKVTIRCSVQQSAGT